MLACWSAGIQARFIFPSAKQVQQSLIAIICIGIDIAVLGDIISPVRVLAERHVGNPREFVVLFTQ